ncbi:hypothetical protein HVC08_005233 [Salmonella enterica]|nr:hypothetical protein [Salmonella enterica]
MLPEPASGLLGPAGASEFRAIAGSSEPAAATLLSKLMQAEIIENIVSGMDFESHNLLILLIE